MDRVKKLKVKKTDGSFTDYIPIGADAENIDLEDGSNVQDEMNKMYNKPYYFNSVVEMKNADYLKEGDCVITLGYYEINDCKEEFYKIRNILDTDIIDNYNIIALSNYPNLIAERIKTKPDKKYVIIGDSYTEGYTPDGNVTSWAQLFKTNLNIPSNRIAIYYKGGAGFSRNRENNFYQYITDTILTNDSNVTDVLIVGGYNDNGESADNIKSGVADTISLLKTKYPNAIIHTGIIGYSNNANVNLNMRNVYLNTFRSSVENGAKYLANVENILHNPYTMFASDGYHPNQIGQTRLFEYITESLFNGKADIKYDNVTLLNELPYLSSNMSNNIINIRHNNRETLSVSIDSLICDGSNQYEIGTITNNYFVGSVFISIPLLLDLTAGSYKMTQGVLRISGNKIYAICFALQDDNSGYYTALNVRNIIIPDFSCAVNSDFI